MKLFSSFRPRWILPSCALVLFLAMVVEHAPLRAQGVNPDSDGDGLPDAWEQKYFGTLAYGATDDPGGVGRTLLQSYQQGLSPWPAATVAGGLRVWYRADLGVTKDAGNKVSAWADLSGNAGHVVQTANPTRQPAWNGSVAALYGKPAVQFDGTTGLTSAAAVDVQAGSNDQTVIAVIVPGATQQPYSSIVDLSSDTTGHGWVLGQLGSQTNQYEMWWMDAAFSGWQPGPSVTPGVGQAQVLSLTKSGASATSYLNGALQNTGTAPAALAASAAALAVGNRVSAVYGFTGQIAEVLVYDRALSDAERQQVEQQMLTRYVNPDSDGDGLPDAWELKYFGTLAYGATDDPGGVGRTLLQSYQQSLSPWPAATVASGLRVWYRADLGVTKDTNGKVSRWADLSGNGGHVVQTTTASRQPAWLGSVAALYGNPAVQFDGTTGLTSAAAVDVQSGSNDQTVIAVVVPGATQQPYSSIVDLSSDTTGHGWVLGQSGSQTNQYEMWWMDAALSGWQSGPNVTPSAGQVQVLTLTKNGTIASSYLNGAAQGVGAAPAALSAPAAALAVGNRVSAIYGFTGQIAEVLVYNRALTTAERQQIETQALARYVNPDSDGDGLPDAWEQKYFGTLAYGAGDDPGGVGRTLLQSYQQGLSPWPAATVAGGLRVWYRADLGVTKDASNKVSAWADLSGNAGHVVQTANASLQPTWVASVQSGKPAVQFNGTTVLTTAASIDVQAGSNDQTVIAVVVPAATQQPYSSIVDLNSDSGHGWVLGQQGSQTNQYEMWWMDAAQSGWQSGPGVTATAGQIQLLSLVKNGTTAISYLNGASQGTGAAPAAILAPVAPLAIGNRVSTLYGFTGQVAEVLVYNRALSDTERQQVEQQITNRYINQPPTVTLTAPTSGATFIAPATIGLAATASDPDGTVAKVEFYQNGTKIGESTTAPYQFSVTNLAVGTYGFKARAYDNNNAFTDSATATVTVMVPPTPPTVSLISPASGSASILPLAVNLVATASSASGTIAKVEFYQGATKLGQATQSPYTYVWSGMSAGSYSLSAIAYDNLGASTVSDTVSLTVIGGAKLILKADSGVSTDASGNVNAWQDQSGHGNTAQAGGGQQPQLVANALNGLPVVRFDGASSLLTLPDFMSGFTAGEVFVALKIASDASASNRGLWRMGTASAGYYPLTGGAIWDDWGSAVLMSATVQPPVPLEQYHFYNVSSDAGQWTDRINGLTVFTRNTNTVAFSSSPWIGLNRADQYGGYFKGDIAEMIVFDRTLTSSERDAIGTYLAHKYALPTIPIPAAPTGVAANGSFSTQVSLSWNVPAGGPATVYTIERKTGNGDFATIADLSNSSGYFLDTGLAASTTYTYRIKARSYAGSSGYSSSVDATTLAAIPGFPATGMRLWLRADDTGLTAGGPVPRWPDQSGLGNDATQTTASSQPQLVTGALNGRPVVHFSGGNVLTLPNAMSGATAGEIVAILRAPGWPNRTDAPWAFGSTDLGTLYYSGGTRYDDFGSTSGENFSGPPASVINNYHIYDTSARSGEWISRFNGLTQYRRSANTVSFSGAPLIGQRPAFGDSLQGDIAEMIVFDRVLTDQEREAVGTYLTNKYAPSAIAAPVAPTNLVAHAVSATQASLGWSMPATSVGTVYTIERQTGSGSFSAIADVANDLGYLDSGLIPGTVYTYRVKARTYAGSSGYSNSATATTLLVSGNFPASGMRIWLRADAGVSAFGSINRWADQSGQGNDATQATAASQPQLVAGAANGHPVVRFNGSNVLNLPNAMNGATAGEIIAVVKAPGWPSRTDALWSFGTAGLGSLYYAGGTRVDDFGSNGGGNYDGPAPAIINNYHIYDASSAPGEWISRFNGLTQYRRNTNTVAFTTTPLIGQRLVFGDSLQGDIAEVIVFDRVLTSQEREAIGTYLTAKYAPPAITAPAAPTNLVTSAVSASQASLSWSVSATAVGTIYTIERQTGSGSFSAVAEVADSLGYVDTGLAAGTAYVYRVKARTYAGTSGYSNTAAVSTFAAGLALPGDGMRLWLMADEGIVVTGNGVGTWLDQSGHGNDATEAALGSNRPQLVPNVLNGHPVVRFDGSNSGFALPNFMNGATEGEVFVVVSASSGASPQNRGLWRMGATDFPQFRTNSGLAEIADDWGSAAMHEIGNPAQPLNQFNLYNISSGAMQWVARLNGGVVYQTQVNTVSFRSDPLLGQNGADLFSGDIAEVIIYDHVLSPQDRETVGFYLNRKYAFASDQNFGDYRDTNGDGLTDNVDRQLGLDPYAIRPPPTPVPPIPPTPGDTTPPVIVLTKPVDAVPLP